MSGHHWHAFKSPDAAVQAKLSLNAVWWSGLHMARAALCCTGLTEAAVRDVTHLWYKGQGLAKGAIDDFPVPLFFRLATTADVRQVPKHQQNGQKQVNSHAR